MTDLQALTMAYYQPHALALLQGLGAVWLVVFFWFSVSALCSSH
jgi:hypothetical protein